MVGWYTIFVLFGVFCFTIILLFNFPSKKTPIIVYFLVFIGWFTTFGIIALVPYDIFLTLTSEGDENLLLVAWIVVYWTAFCLCWLLLPLTEKFHTSGEFKFFPKLKGAIFRQIRSFLIIISLGIVLTLYLYFVQKLTLSRVPKILVFMSNIWGLFLIITLLGFGLVAIPMNCWKQGSLVKSLETLQLRAVPLDEALIDARYRLDQCVSKVVRLGNEIQNTSELRPYIEIILAKCPEHSFERQKSIPITRSAKVEVKYLDLVNLHKELKDLISENMRSECRWDTLVKEAFKLEDILSSKQNGKTYIRSALWQVKLGKLTRCCEFFQWLWFCYLRPVCVRILAILMCIMSLLIILGESTLFLQSTVSLIPIILQYVHGEILIQLYCSCPLLYLILCTYTPLFELKLKGRYGLYSNNHTDPANLLWSACFMARLIPALSLNFILLTEVENTRFRQVMGVVDIVPYFNEGIAEYSPLLLVLFCLLNVFNIYTRIMTSIGLTQLTFVEVLDPSRIAEGKSLIEKARMLKEKKFKEATNYSKRIASGLPSSEESKSLSKPLRT